MIVYIFGTVCSPACANFALRQTTEDHTIFYVAATIKAVNTPFYVDDCLASLPTIQKAQQLVRELTDLLSQRGFRIRKWISNSREVIESIPNLIDVRQYVISTFFLITYQVNKLWFCHEM